jgi:hypothetical protein
MLALALVLHGFGTVETLLISIRDPADRGARRNPGH